MQRISLALQVVLPAVWIGLLLGLSFIESPLKFQAPGITVPLGLGIGRLVFTALNWIGLAILAVLTLASVRPRVGRGALGVLAGLWLVLLAEIVLIRPPLNARSDLVIAGEEPGESVLHYLYIAADVALLGLLVAFLALVLRRLLPHAP